MAVIVGTFMCIIFLTFHKSLVSGIDWQDHLLFGDGRKKNMKINSAENMVLGHCLVDGEGTWSCNPAGNGFTILPLMPHQHGKRGVGSDWCQFFCQQVLGGSPELDYGLGAWGHKSGPIGRPKHWSIWTNRNQFRKLLLWKGSIHDEGDSVV